MSRHDPGIPPHPKAHGHSHPRAPSGAHARVDPAPTNPDPHDLPPPEAVKSAIREISELREYAAYYVGARIDAIKLALRRIGFLAAMGIIAALAIGAVVVTAIVHVCAGLAQLFAVWFGGRVWAGNLVVGILLLAVVAGGAWFGMNQLIGSSRRKTVKKYEHRRTRQRAEFGHDVARRASEAKARD